MGSTLVLAFFGLFVLLIGSSILRRVLNPFHEVAYDRLPSALRTETDRVLPGFQHTKIRTTKNGDSARIDGNYLGNSITVEADFDRDGTLIEFEVEQWKGARTLGLASFADLPEPATREIERVLGAAHPHFNPTLVKRGVSGEETHYEVKGADREWKWEIAVTERGRLLEVEKERRRNA